MTSHDYRGLSIAEKRSYAREQIREPPVRCPHCETAVSVDDLLPHVRSRCPGHRAVHRLSRWVTLKEAMALGVPRVTLWRWVKHGLVLMKGTRYLKRDIVQRMAWRGPPEPDESPPEPNRQLRLPFEAEPDPR